MILTRTFDAALVNHILTSPAIYKDIVDDGAPPANEFDISEAMNESSYFLIPKEQDEVCGMFWLHPLNYITYVAHINMLPQYRGEYALEASQLAINYMLENTPCRKFVTTIPLYYKNAIRFTQKLGFKLEGRLKNAYLKNGQLDDLIIMGLSCQR